MSITKIADDLRRFEGFSGHVYPCPSGAWTIGYGRNVDKQRGGPGISIAEGEILLLNDIERCTNAAKRVVPDLHVHPEAVREVLVEMVFQLGEGGVAQFKAMLKWLHLQDYPHAAAEMRNSKWWREDSRSRAEELAQRVEDAADTG